ncbi:MAG TPA: hypothetical protein VMU19_08430 [Bryobacteraceae bacterium]|nr:hypothetical protein [Bryobacteraceae bacterium]
MKRLLLLSSFCAALAAGADLPVHAVYIMPMAHGMDQFLANRLAGEHVFQVVSDPKLADAVLTDRIGATLNPSLEEISPAPKPPAAEEKPAADKDSKAAPAAGATPKETLADPGLSSSFNRAKGTIFLVDAKSRQVLWSTFDVPKNSSADQLDRTASDIVSRLMRDMKKK